MELFGRHDRFEFTVGQCEGEIGLAIPRAVENANDATIVVNTSEKSGNPLKGSLRCRKSDALRSPTGSFNGEALETLEREAQMTPPLIRGHRVDFVNNHRLHVTHQIATIDRSEEVVERLGGCHVDVRRFANVLLTFRLRRVTRAHGGSNCWNLNTLRLSQSREFLERLLQIEFDVRGQRP